MLRVWKWIRFIYFFGIKLFALNLFLKIFDKEIAQSERVYRILWKKHNIVIRYLQRYTSQYEETRFSDEQEEQEEQEEQVIWTMWWQGEDNAPECIKLCLNSIRENANNHKVVIIHKDNYQQYIEIPQYIIKKFQQGKISVTHLSDIIRMNLLYTYGGLWIDGGILVTKKIEYFEGDYYTLCLPQERYFCISEKRWVAGVCGGVKHYNYFCYMIEMYYLYWKSENELIDYCLTDYFTYVFLSNNKYFKRELNKLRIERYKLNHMLEYMNQKMDYTLLDKLEEVTGYFRISWRNEMRKTVNGELTFYGYFCDKYGV